MSVNTKVNGQLVKSAGLYSVSTPIGMADIYSTEEKEVGVFTDGKPIYSKTVTATSNVATGDGSWADISGAMSPTISNAETLVDAQIHGTVNIDYSMVRFCIVDGVIKCASKVSGNGWYTGLKVTFFYTKTTDTPWSGKFVPQGYGYVSSGDIYSFEERQVGVYADGKPLYQKTMRFTSGWPLRSWATLANLSSLNIERLVKSDGIFTRSSGGTTIQLTFNGSIFPESTNAVQYKVSVRYNNNGNLECFVLTYEDITYIDVTLQYTKTTDVAGSGEYVPSGDKAVHYSTDEEVIGTWIDGSTIYRRTITGLSIQLNGTTWVNYNPSISIDKLINVHAYYEPSGGLMTCAIAEYQYNSSVGIQLTAVQGYNRTVNTLTIEYTKTS